MTLGFRVTDGSRPSTGADEVGQVSTAVIDQHPFRAVLERERARADRADEPLSLLHITRVREDSGRGLSWGDVVAAVAAVKRATDIVGWVSFEEVLGVILTETKTANERLAAQLEERIRRELRRKLVAQTAESVLIRLHIYPEPETGSERAETIGSLLPLIEDIRSGEDFATYEMVKRRLDVLGAGLLLVAAAPLLILLAVGVKLGSPGPVLYRQRRIGHRGQPFMMLKFRTMRADADHQVHQAYVSDFISGRTEASKPGQAVVYKLSNDPRVTRLGILLRKASLDELPQLWNVLRGDMSLVGPRPPLPYEVEQYKSWHRRRILEARPGITGLWQVTGRSRTTFDEMVRLDLRYVQTRSLWTDLKILLRTPMAVIGGSGAQ